MSTTVEELAKADDSLKISHSCDKLLRDDSIQCFEFCIELFWKVAKVVYAEVEKIIQPLKLNLYQQI
ncbi:MAG: hypothetical protein H7Z71_03065 [Moraxellaceae bacterium]|nr:hypothetical protein [Pseudobdellovibrionaceae bacterium]